MTIRRARQKRVTSDGRAQPLASQSGERRKRPKGGFQGGFGDQIPLFPQELIQGRCRSCGALLVASNGDVWCCECGWSEDYCNCLERARLERAGRPD